MDSVQESQGINATVLDPVEDSEMTSGEQKSDVFPTRPGVEQSPPVQCGNGNLSPRQLEELERLRVLAPSLLEWLCPNCACILHSKVAGNWTSGGPNHADQPVDATEATEAASPIVREGSLTNSMEYHGDAAALAGFKIKSESSLWSEEQWSNSEGEDGFSVSRVEKGNHFLEPQKFATSAQAAYISCFTEDSKDVDTPHGHLENENQDHEPQYPATHVDVEHISRAIATAAEAQSSNGRQVRSSYGREAQLSDGGEIQSSNGWGAQGSSGHEALTSDECEMQTPNAADAHRAGNDDFQPMTPSPMSEPSPSNKKPTREVRVALRLQAIERNKDFLCKERIQGRLVNIVEGLELHKGVFSKAEQDRLIKMVLEYQELGRKGQLRARTYSEPRKWMAGKGRVTIQFGCCYNYATDSQNNPPGIMRDEQVDPLPPLLKTTIRRLIEWRVLPEASMPDSCIINIYDVRDCIPPHIDHHDFVRPFCTLSLLSECSILFGTKLKVVGEGLFDGPFSIPLPVGSVLVLNGNGADVAKHAVPGVPSKRISITFRKMDPSRVPRGYEFPSDLRNVRALPL